MIVLADIVRVSPDFTTFLFRNMHTHTETYRYAYNTIHLLFMSMYIQSTTTAMTSALCIKRHYGTTGGVSLWSPFPPSLGKRMPNSQVGGFGLFSLRVYGVHWNPCIECSPFGHLVPVYDHEPNPGNSDDSPKSLTEDGPPNDHCHLSHTA